MYTCSHSGFHKYMYMYVRTYTPQNTLMLGKLYEKYGHKFDLHFSVKNEVRVTVLLSSLAEHTYTTYIMYIYINMYMYV